MFVVRAYITSAFTDQTLIVASEKPTIYLVINRHNLNYLRAGIHKVETYFQEELINAKFDNLRIVPVYWNGLSFVVEENFASCRLGGKKKELSWNPSVGDLVFFQTFSQIKFMGKQNFLKISRNCRVVVSIYDLLPLTNPEWFKPYMVQSFQEIFSWVLKRANILVVNSNHTKGEISKYLESNEDIRADLPSISVVHLWSIAEGIQKSSFSKSDSDPVNRNSFSNNNPVITIVSTIEPRKGHFQVMEAASAAWSIGKQFNLIFVGQMGWISNLQQKVFFDFILQYSNCVKWIPDANDAEVADIYKNSSMLLSSSFDEGFGLPVAEAIILGIPVLLRNISVYKELFGRCAVLFGKGEQFKTLEEAFLNIEYLLQQFDLPLGQKMWPMTSSVDALITALFE